MSEHIVEMGIMNSANELRTEVKKSVETPFMGTLETKYTFHGEPKLKLTRRQKGLIKRFVNNHINNPEYIPLWVFISISKYFAGVTVRYFPKKAHNTIYSEKTKTFYVGVKGGVHKMEVRSSFGKERNITRLWNYYMEAKD